MTGGGVRFFLRTSTSWLGGVILLAYVIQRVVSTQARWAGDWWWGYNNLALVMPAAAVIGAFCSAWDLGSRRTGWWADELRGPVAPWRHWSLRMVAEGAPLLLAYLLGVMAVVLLTYGHGGEVPAAAALVVMSHLLAIMSAVSVGALLARLQPSRYAAITATAVIAVLALGGGRIGFMLYGLSGPGQIGSVEPNLAHYAASSAILLIMVLATAPWPWALGGRPWRQTNALTGAGLLVLLSAVSLRPAHRLFTVVAQPSTECLGEQPQVCLLPGYQRLLEPAHNQLVAVMQLAADAGVPRERFPSRFQQAGSQVTTGPSVGGVYLSSDALEEERVSLFDAALSLSTPEWCSALANDLPPDGLLSDRQLVLDWLLLLGEDVSFRAFRSAHPRFVRLSAEQRAVAIEDSLGRMRRCVT